ncbi:probable histone-arginine methyltransferase CARM1 [Amaranthus tricolor]|uniref:probable histone-arginine methyltransferase CARM1 n=1 Tax=Amaranthus tricolor TaxID=29722 RepID=UPI0025898505|nr:probable histone-arginine methyltransferase CARM1 [Amaranthus tricolor]
MAESELQSGVVSVTTSKSDSKTEASPARTYFLHYTQLLHHQNMLQEYLRTGSYHAAIMENCVAFAGKVVVDVGAGSGILSLFAARAGAKHVYAVEASEMSEYALKLIAGNPSLSDRITVVKGKVEEVELPEKADILISEPMGTLLVHEMMLKSYVIARDRFLVPSGKMFPKVGRIHMAPFSDKTLFEEIANKALFWRQENYFGVDLTSLYESVCQGYFSQPVVDTFDPKLLVAPAICHVLDLTSIKEEQLYDIEIPLKFTAKVDKKVHGLACWFDVLFDESSVPRLLITATGYPTIYWFKLRCLLAKPLYVMAGQEITGHLHMVAHDNQSYTLYLELSAEMCGAGAEPRGTHQTSYGRIELKDLYYRMSQPYIQTQSNAAAQDQQPQQLIEEMNQLII